MDSSSSGTGLMAVFAVSGGVVFLALQVHKRLHSNFMRKIDFAINHDHPGIAKEYKLRKKAKKVRFANEVTIFNTDK